MTSRTIKVKGEQISFLAHADSAEQLITGTVTGDAGTAGIVKVKGTYLYWIDDDGNERRKQGTATGGTGTAGVINVKGEEIYYIDNNGDERSLSAELSIVIYEGTVGYGAVVRASDGRLWAVYSAGTTIYAQYSDDDGETWSAAETVATESYSGIVYGPHLDLVIDSNDVPHVLYSVRTGTITQRRIYYVHRTGGSWSVKQDVFGNTDYWLRPKISIDSTDDIHCVCYRAGRIVYFRQTAGVWGAETIIAAHTVGTTRYFEQDIAIDSNNYIHVVYCGNSTTRDIHYRLNNGSWQAEETVAGFGDGTIQRNPLVEVDSGDVVHIVWAGRGYGGTYEQINHRSGNSGSWNTIENLTQSIQPQGTPYGLSFAINTNDDIDICFAGSTYSTSNSVWITGNHRKYTGGAWGTIDVFSDYNSTRVHGMVREDNLLATGYMVTFGGRDGYYRFLNGE